MNNNLSKFRPIILSIKISSSSSTLTPNLILSIIDHLRFKLPKEKIIYSYFPRDSLTDWFKGYGFIHFKPSQTQQQQQQQTTSFDYPKKLLSPTKNQGYTTTTTHHQPLEQHHRFATIRSNPIQEIQILNLDHQQLQLSDFQTVYKPITPSPTKIKSLMELSQSNHSSGIQSRSILKGYRPKLNPEEFIRFKRAFESFGGFRNQ